MPAEIRVEEATEMFDGLVPAMAGLVGQLSRSSSAPSPDEVEEIVRSPACHLLLAREPDGTILGMLTLVVFRIPTGVRAWIEDVVVDQDARGKGVGAALNRAAIRLADERGARTVDLTSRPSREAANRLYRRLGFVPRETNVYRFEGPPPAD
jgi:ribosomal protein S18 acetylase RimI-like enzyme